MTDPVWELHPLVGAGPLRFGMSLDEVVAHLGPPEQAPEPVWRSSTLRAGWQGGAIAVHFAPTARFVEFSALRGVEVRAFGVDVLRAPADEVVAALVGLGHAATASERGHSYLFPALQLALWRAVVPDGPDDDEGRRFDAVSVAVAGYHA